MGRVFLTVGQLIMNRLQASFPVVVLCCLLHVLFLQGCGVHYVHSPVETGEVQPPVDWKDPVAVSRALDRQYREWKGVPHRDGGLSRNGIDCSGFVYLTYVRLFDIELPRTTDGFAGAGVEVSRRELQKGDVVLFSTGWFRDHAGIYMGNGQFMHVSSKKGVMLSGMNDYYWNDRFTQGRRLLTWP